MRQLLLAIPIVLWASMALAVSSPLPVSPRPTPIASKPVLLCMRDTLWPSSQIQCGDLTIPSGHSITIGFFGVTPIPANVDIILNDQTKTIAVTSGTLNGLPIGIIGTFTPAVGFYTLSLAPVAGFSSGGISLTVQ